MRDPDATPDLYFTLKIRCEHDAFVDYPPRELTRLLHQVAEALPGRADQAGRNAAGVIYDVNGGHVGVYELNAAETHGVEVDVHLSAIDDAVVVQIDTTFEPGDPPMRVNLNEATLWRTR